MLKVLHPQYCHRSLYTIEEDTKIVKYIIAKKIYHDLRGNLSWKKMEKDGVCPGRSWQSLKERFRKCIIYKLFKLKISDEEKNKVYNSYHNNYDDNMDDNVVRTKTKRNNTNDKDANENCDGQINTKRKRATNQLEDCDINNSSLKCTKTLKSRKTVTEDNNEENSSNVRKQSQKEFRYNMRETNLTKNGETLEKSVKSGTAMHKNYIQNGAGNIISEDMEDNDDPRIRKTLTKKISYLWGAPYSEEEDKQIVLFFKRNIGMLRLESIYETLQQDCGLQRTTSSLRRRFIEVILPKLYKYKELTYLDMVSIYDSMGHEVPIQAQELINKDIEAQSSQSTLDELEIINKINRDIPQIIKKSVECETKRKRSSNLKTIEKEVLVVSTDDPNWRANLESKLCHLFELPVSSVTDKMFKNELPVKNVDEDANSESSSVLEVESAAKEISVVVVNDCDRSISSNAEISTDISCMDNNMLSIVMKHFGNVQHAFILNRNCDFPFLHTHLTDNHGILPENIHIVGQEFFETFLMCAQAKIDFKKEIAKICQLMFEKDIPVDNSKLVIKENIALCYPKKCFRKKRSSSCLEPHNISPTLNRLPETRVILDEIVLEVSHSETEFDNAGVHKNNFKNSQNPRVNSSKSGCSTITQIDPAYDKETDTPDTDSSDDCRSLSNMGRNINNLTSLDTSQIIEPCSQDWGLEPTQINEWDVAATQVHVLDIGSTESNKLDLELTQVNEWDPTLEKITELNLGLTQDYLNNKTSSKAIHVESGNEEKIHNMTKTDANNHTLLLLCNQNIVSDEMSLRSIQENSANKESTIINQDNIQKLSDNEMELGSTQDNTQTAFLTCNKKISNEIDLGSTQEDSTNKTSTKITQDNIPNLSVNEMDLGSTQEDETNKTSTQINQENIPNLSDNEMDLGSTPEDSTNKTSTKINQNNIQNLSVNELDLGSTEDNTQTSFFTCNENMSNEMDLGSTQEDSINKTSINQDNMRNLSVNEMDLRSTQDKTNTQTSFLTCDVNISNEMDLDDTTNHTSLKASQIDLGSTQDDTNNHASLKITEMDLRSTQDHDHTYTETSFLTCNQNMSNEMDLDDTTNHTSLKASQIDLGSTQDDSTPSKTNQMGADIIIKLENDEMDLDFTEVSDQTSEIRTQENYKNEIGDPCQNVVAKEIVE